MGKHLTALLIIIATLSLGYGLWLYSESLRTGSDYSVLLKNDLQEKKQVISGWLK